MSAYAPDLEAILATEPEPPVGVLGEEVRYEVAGGQYLGYVARPADGLAHPGVLVLHDWLGVTDTTRMRCDMLARLGYVAFAGDMYGAELRPGPAEAPSVVGTFYGDVPFWRTRIVGAFERLREFDDVEQDRLAALGYCFGGAATQHLARTGANLRAAISFHGSLVSGSLEEARSVLGTLLILHGAADPHVPDAQVQAFEDELRQTDVDWELVAYAGAMHAFTVPGADAPEHGSQYHERADRRSWTAMKDLLAERFA